MTRLKWVLFAGLALFWFWISETSARNGLWFAPISLISLVLAAVWIRELKTEEKVDKNFLYIGLVLSLLACRPGG